MGNSFDELGYYTKAIEAYKQAIHINPNCISPHYNLGIIYGELGYYTKAIEANKQAIRIDPEHVNAHYNLGIIYLMIRDKSSALNEYKILKELDIYLANELFDLIY